MSISMQCLDCKHYTGLSTCDAFPDKIPQEIFDGRVIHDEPYPGDGGIMYDPIDIELSTDQMVHVAKILDDKGLLKGEKGVKMEWRTVTRGGKTFRQRYRVGKTEPEKGQVPDIPVVLDVPDIPVVLDVPDALADMTLEEFEENPVEGFVYDPRLDYDEIIAERRHDKGRGYTALSTQFFKNKPVDKKRLLFHEMGHDLDSGGINDFMDLLILRENERTDMYNIPHYKNWFGLSGRPQEIMADTYSILRTGLWRDWVGSKKVEAGRFLFRVATVAKELGYPVPKDIHEELTEYFEGDIDISRKEKVKITKGTDPGKIAHLPEAIQDEIVTLHKFPYTPEQIVSNIETMIQLDCDDDTDLKDQLISKGVIKSADGKISLDLTLKEMGDWAQSVLDEEVKKFEIPDELLEAIDIDPKKMSPGQIKAMFAKLKEKGLLNDKPADKKSTGKGSADKAPEGAQGSGKAGLVKKKVTVHRDGKTFEQERWVKAGEDEPVDKPKKGKEEPGDKPGKGKDDTGEGTGEEPGKPAEPKKPEGPAIKGLNKPEGEDKEPDEKSDEKPDEKPDEKSDEKPDEKPDKKTESEKIKPEKFDMSKDNLVKLQSGSDVGLPVSKHADMIHLATFKDGKGIHKVITDNVDMTGEIGYHDLAKELGWDMVPQTEKVDLLDREATCQAFVEGKGPYYGRGSDGIKITEKHFNDIAKIFAMDMVVGNNDRHFQNVKINENGRVWAIDNDTWTETSPYLHQGTNNIEKAMDAVQHKCDDKGATFNPCIDWLEQSLDKDDFKNFQGVLHEKLTELMKSKDKISGFYEMTEDNEIRKPYGIMANIEHLETYLGK